MGGSHNLPPILASIGAVLLIACLAFPGLLHADYRITHKEKTIQTQCYWIQDNMLYLCEGGEPLALSEVRAIEAGDMTALEAELYRDTLRRFFMSLAWLGDRESEIMENDDALAKGLLELDELLKQKVRNKELKELRKKLLAETDVIRRRVISLKESWEDLRVPERRMTRLTRLKSLQLLAWLQSLQESEIFVETLDPTFRALALEHGRQSVQFGALYVESVLHFGGESFE